MTEQLTINDLLGDHPLPAGTIQMVPMTEALKCQGLKPDSRLVDSMRTIGQLVPIIIVQTPEQQLLVVAGRRRVGAATELEWETIRAEVITVHDDQLRHGLGAALTLIENTERKPNPVGEARAIRSLVERGYDIDTIAKATGMNKATIQKRLKLVNLPDTMLDAVASGKVATGIAEKLAQMTPTRREQAIAHFEEEGKLQNSDLDRIRQVAYAEAVALIPREMMVDTEPDWQAQVDSLLTRAWEAASPDQGWQAAIMQAIDFIALMRVRSEDEVDADTR